VKKANLLTRIPSLRYRFHPYQRDDHVQQAGEAAEVDRVREALGRCVPAVLAYFLSVAVSTRARCTYFPSEKHTLLSMSPFSAMPVAATVQLTIKSAPHNPASACMFDFLLRRYLTHVHWLEDVFAPARPNSGGSSSAGEEGGENKGTAKSRELGGLLMSKQGDGGKMIFYDDDTLAAQEVCVSACVCVCVLLCVSV